MGIRDQPMTEAQDLFARLGFDKSTPQPPQPVDLTGYLIDLSVRKLSPVEIAKRREDGVYRNVRPQDFAGYLGVRS